MKLEYGLLIALIASVIVIALTHTSVQMKSPFRILSDQLSGSNLPCGCDSDQAAVDDAA